jgi:hypothetical protein
MGKVIQIQRLHISANGLSPAFSAMFVQIIQIIQIILENEFLKMR